MVSYERGSDTGLYFGRVSLCLFQDERFAASYRHHETAHEWKGHLAPGTFAKACTALEEAGFVAGPHAFGLAPGEYPLELGWLRDDVWQRCEVRDADRNRFFKIRVLASTILSVLDANLARMPPGETTPVTEQERVP
jgi:hypothetical protein